MGRVKEMWYSKVQALCEAYDEDKIDQLTFLNRMMDLGFSMEEAIDYVDGINDNG